MKTEIVWTIAGFDPSSGAGVTADLMTFAAHGLFGCSAITALTVQSTLGVAETSLVDSHFLARTLAHLDADLRPDGIKIGMLGGSENMTVVAEFLQRHRRNNAGDLQRAQSAVVLDPVLRSSSGRELYPAEKIAAMRAELLPWVDFVTPNWAELSILTGLPVSNLLDAEFAGASLAQAHPGLHVVATGGDASDCTDLLVLPGGESLRFLGEHVATSSTHGTGCAFSSALLAHLVRGERPREAVAGAKRYVHEALLRAPGIGHGKGPLGLLRGLSPAS